MEMCSYPFGLFSLCHRRAAEARSHLKRMDSCRNPDEDKLDEWRNGNTAVALSKRKVNYDMNTSCYRRYCLTRL